jgi:hypothetical protein
VVRQNSQTFVMLCNENSLGTDGGKRSIALGSQSVERSTQAARLERQE